MTYSRHNLAGEVEKMFYSDGTPSVTNAYNRLRTVESST
jgi:hypothetical protein